jgi:hypothetical protein
MPAPKKTLKTIPSAVSSLIFGNALIPTIASVPRIPLSAAPVRRTTSDFPSHPIQVANMKASPIPGNVAWLNASPINARRRSKAKLPTNPAANPKSPVPTTTTRVL